MALLHLVSHFFFLYRSPSFSLCTVFDAHSSSTNEVLSVNLSANVFPDKDWNDLKQSYSDSNCPTRIPTCDSYCPALLDMFISSDSSICSTVAFLSLGKSDHVFVSAFVFFPSKCRKWYHFLLTILVLIGMVFVINQKMFLESLSLNMLLLQLLLNFVSGSRLELMYISLIINIRLNLIHSHGF